MEVYPGSCRQEIGPSILTHQTSLFGNRTRHFGVLSRGGLEQICALKHLVQSLQGRRCTRGIVQKLSHVACVNHLNLERSGELRRTMWREGPLKEPRPCSLVFAHSHLRASCVECNNKLTHFPGQMRCSPGRAAQAESAESHAPVSAASLPGMRIRRCTQQAAHRAPTGTYAHIPTSLPHAMLTLHKNSGSLLALNANRSTAADIGPCDFQPQVASVELTGSMKRA